MAKSMNEEKKKSKLSLGLGMALIQNPEALKAFGKLSVCEQQNFIENAHGIRTSEEMCLYVDTLKKRRDCV